MPLLDGGDAYDHAVDGDVLHVSLFDAMGHDTAAGLTASVALVIRGGRRVATLESVPMPDPPMGFGLGMSRGLLRYQLEPGDRLLFYTDGIVEARSPDGELFGLEGFAGFVVRHEADGVSAPETLRRLIQAILRHQGGRLQDDATVLTVEWYGERHRLMTLS
ncbi:Stage II sporulation protein E (SpoIIE) [Nonomuraea coxensis DSM 45129]|uniref:Stage II sporulation protein E (SpoIIE) n=1 Tax=Nonomuraea coxensis DSM 45129 TaxID=1122611 RepID=A0ABX8U8A3_9ACTN|nr:PP2C family protein-serine/threonine phosphatase [Nonomuraea coxensis]QYC42897.1 Stage II sporulation protein E (SpoIIE) [Nonomuraea coxensis DSM 45129]